MLAEIVTTNIENILYVTGALTAGVVVVAIAPAAVLRTIVGAQPLDHVGVYFARHWAIVVGITGCLLIAAAANVSLREAILLAASVSKGAFVLMIIANLGNGLGRGLIPALIFDAACVAMYVIYLSAA